MNKEELLKELVISPLIEIEGPTGKYVIDISDTLCIILELIKKDKNKVNKQ